MGSSDAELDRFKQEISLIDYAAARGYVVDRSASSCGSVVLRNPVDDDKIVVGRGADEHWTYFSVRDDGDRGSIIDFAQRRGTRNLGEVRKELRPWIGAQASAARTTVFAGGVLRHEYDPARVAASYARARACANSLYLNSRGIRPETLSDPRFSGTWRVGARGNVLFPHHAAGELTGYEIKNRGFTGFASGGRRSLWSSRDLPGDTRVVFVESAIDALSFHQLEPGAGTRYRSVGGAFGDRLQEVIADEVRRAPPGLLVVAAFDADDAGRKYTAKLERAAEGRAVVRVEPVGGKDWNDVLQQREAEFIRALGQRRAAPSRGIGR